MFDQKTQESGPKKVADWAQAIRAVAFDMDGLLVNTEELYTEVGVAILSRRGRKFTAELKSSMMGLPGDRAFALMIEQEQLSDSVEQLAIESEEIFSDLLPKKLEVLPGLMELLRELDERQLPRCVATSSTHRFADRVLEIVSLTDRFDFVVTAEDVDLGKPQPDIYLEAARRMQVSASSMLVLEDSHHGTRAGIAAGACTVAVPGDHSQHQDFSGVHYRAHTLADTGIRHILGGGESASTNRAGS